MEPMEQSKCVRTILSDARESLGLIESQLDCGVSPEKFGESAVEVSRIISDLELCRQRMVAKSQS